MTQFHFTLEQTAQIKALYEEQSFLTAAGIFYGFPLCCVRGFVDGSQLEVSNEYAGAPYLGTGFMACRCCAPQTQKDWVGFQAKINEARYCSTPFPEEGEEEEIYHFYIDLIEFLGDSPKEKISQLSRPKEIMRLWKARQKAEKLEKATPHGPALSLPHPLKR